MGYYNPFKKDLKDWLNMPNKPKCASEDEGKPYRDEVLKCILKLTRINILTFFMFDKLGIYNARMMHQSALKQRKLFRSVYRQLFYYRLEDEWIKVFNRDVNSIDERARYVFKICIENIKLTKYYPYFEHAGFDELKQYAVDCIKRKDDGDMSDISDFANRFAQKIEDYNNSHAEEIEEYMKSIEPTLEMRRKEAERIEAEERAEKEQKKLENKKEREYIALIKKNQKEEEKRRKQIKKWDEYYYR